MRICIAYDCLFPWTIGGAERWYRNLAEQLVADGHAVTYLTRQQWDLAAPPDLPGVRVIAVSQADELYGPDGGRRIAPTLRFGRGVLGHLLRHGRDYDAVHLCSFPYFSVLAAAAARPFGRYRLLVDWFEVWTRDYWRSYIGPLQGEIGHAVQTLCARVPQQAFCFSRLHEQRLLQSGLRGPHIQLAGLYAGSLEPPQARPSTGVVLTLGRLIPEKQVHLAVIAVARARQRGLDVRGLILGDGPERARVLETIAEHGLEGIVEAPGFVDGATVAAALDNALCLLHPSAREGYGLAVVEACAHGTPAIVAAGPDNAAAELITPGENGYVAPSADPDDLAEALLAVEAAGLALRERTCDWFAANADRLSLNASLATVSAAYRSG